MISSAWVSYFLSCIQPVAAKAVNAFYPKSSILFRGAPSLVLETPNSVKSFDSLSSLFAPFFFLSVSQHFQHVSVFVVVLRLHFALGVYSVDVQVGVCGCMWFHVVSSSSKLFPFLFRVKNNDGCGGESTFYLFFELSLLQHYLSFRLISRLNFRPIYDHFHFMVSLVFFLPQSLLSSPFLSTRNVSLNRTPFSPYLPNPPQLR